MSLLSTSIIITLISFLSIIQPTLADIYITSPISTYSGVGGQSINVQWQDSGVSPLLTNIGPCSIDIFTGSINQQTWLQNLGESVDVGTTSSVITAVDDSLGPDGDFYFIRFTSLSLKDSTNPQYPHEAFSAKFTLTGMQGSFNSTVLAQINNANVVTSSSTIAPSPTSTSSSTRLITTTTAKSSLSNSTTATATASSSAGSAKTTTSSAYPRSALPTANGKGIMVMGCFVGVFGVVLGLVL